ncbi:MAG TPA: phytoene/squalene synthase family protein [Burkholderiaceae bacterium]|jgi:phytoene synthase|nr:phytoene/squalene synthase family protein [Burkholderiaceae bacterium]
MDTRSHPRTPDCPPTAEARADILACRAVLRRHARSFHAASLLLPRAVRDPAAVLYGFCRVADDAVDVEGGLDDAIGDLRDRLARAYAGTPRPSPIDRALARVVAAHDIPRILPERLVEGLEWDAEGRRYETLEDLLDYASRVAGAVGAMMAVLMGVRSSSGLARACDLGVAMQLSNIARDVAEDAAIGRLYLPAAWMREAGLDPAAWLARPRPSTALEGVVARLLAVADELYERAAAGIGELPLACRPGINAARLLYAAIGHAVARAGSASMARRVGVSKWQRAWLLSRAVATPWPRARGRHAPALPANAALVRAAQREDREGGEGGREDGRVRTGGAGFVIDLLMRLEHEERGRRVPRAQELAR